MDANVNQKQRLDYLKSIGIPSLPNWVCFPLPMVKGLSPINPHIPAVIEKSI